MFSPTPNNLVARLIDSRLPKIGNEAAFDLNAMQPMEIASSALGKLPAATRQHVMRAAAKYGVDANALAAVVFKESSGNPNAESRSGNHFGLMQLSRDILKQYGVKNWRDPQENLRGGIAYMKDMVKEAAKILNVSPERVTTLQAYMHHQQGEFGGGGLVRSAARGETIPAWKAIQNRVSEVGGNISEERAKRNLRGNVPSEFRNEFNVNTGTAADFLRVWEKRIGADASRPFLAR